MLSRTNANGYPATPPADRSLVSAVFSEEARLHLLLVRSKPTPALLREVARVHALLEGGVR